MSTLTLSIMIILCWGGWAVTQKMAVTHSSPFFAQFMSMVWFTLFIPLISVLMRTIGVTMTWSTSGFLWAGAGAVLSTAAGILFLFAVRGSQVHLVTGITSSYPVITLLLSWAFLSERITLLRVVGIAVIVLGAVLLEM